MCCKGAVIDGNYDPTACTASECDGSISGNKCDQVTTMNVIVPQSSSQVIFQIHDGRIHGDISCSGGDCCGGSGTSCVGATSGVCNTVIDVSSCPNNGGIRGGFNRECFTDDDCNELYSTGTCGQYTCEQNEGLCVEFAKPVGTVCRLASGVCDITEVCDGESTDCPTDSVKDSAAVCRVSAGVCDETEMCDGSSKYCPPDSVKDTSVVCRDAAGLCDLEEKCDGFSVSCPHDALRTNGTICRVSADACDVNEVCDGVTVDCPSDVRRDVGHSFKCGRNCYVCAIQPKYILSSTKTTSISTCNLGACASVEYLPWPSCMGQCVNQICPNAKALSNAEFFSCVPSTGMWRCNKKVETNGNTTYPVCA